MAGEIASRAAGAPMLAPRTLDEAMKFSELLARSDLVPRDYKGKPGNILVAMQWGYEIGLQPLQALQNIAVINGRPSIWGDAALALVRGSGLCDSLVERIDGEGDKAAAICIAQRKGQQEPIVARFSVADARKAGLWGKAGPWTQYPARMLAMRARGFCLRDGFADVLRGVITVEEARDYPAEPRDVTPNVAAELDEFAAALPGPTDDEFLRLAQTTADEGTEAFKAWWKPLSRANRDALRPHLNDLQARAEAADRTADQPNEGALEDPFGLPPAEEQHPPDEPAATAGEEPPIRRATTSPAASPSAPAPKIITVRKGADGATDWDATIDDLIAGIRATTGLPEANAFLKRYASLVAAMPEDSYPRWEDAMRERMTELEGVG